MEAERFHLPSAHHPDELIMVSKRVENRQVSGRMFLLRLVYGLGAGVAAALLVAAVMPSAGPASAQDAAQPDPVRPAGAPAQAAQPTTDPITNEQIELLKESGLIDKQSRLSEGLLLMERQLQQAELVGQLLAVLGPDAQIEVTPGEFRSFADTPAGMRQQIEYLKLQSELLAAKGETGVSQETRSSILEIYGKSDDLVAVISVNGRSTPVETGDQLEDGSEVLSISAEMVELQRPDGTVQVLRAP
ncbi:MAG: hypothetical protein IOD05_08580 [Rhodobacter sp.]|nr:hypothetical protein [Rhodobacter sp.]MCA3492109.1 hypothetical protein [Rhodobacter sp.]MCA3500363.1 hypothetical protein [Rhodobacter sp.]MCA3503288.1 hypothetical protein [Rhodobacter sp.]MCA3517608.1 hypothetical protein [Rhodobacter sp.]